MSQLNFIKHVCKWVMQYPKTTKSKFAILVDYLSLYRKKGLTMDEYYEFEFENQGEQFRNDFLGVREQRYYLEQLNPFKYFIFSRNKYAAHKFFENTAIRTSQLYCYYDPLGRFDGSNEIASNTKEVVKILKDKHVEQCVIKATEESHGDNVVVVKAIEFLEDDCQLLLHDGSSKLLSQILVYGPRIFESVIKQSKQISSLNESSVNTVRFMTVLYPDGDAKIIMTAMRVGREGKCVDNAGSGGNIDICVDVETGILKLARQFDGWRKTKKIEKHPDSGMQLNGMQIENWEYIKQEVIKYQQAFPWCKAAGWDIAITDEGPIVIEVNDMWDRTFQYFIERGWRPEIRDCFLAWQKSGYKVYRGRLENDFSTEKCQQLFNN